MVTRGRRSRRGSGSRAGSQRRKTQWVDSLQSFALATGGKQETSLLSDLIPQDTQGMTLVRTIIRLFTFPGESSGALGAQAIDLGIGVADQEAFAAAVLPDPEVAGDEPALGWVWRDRLVSIIPSDGDVISHMLQADIKSQRKIDDGELYFSASSTSILGTSHTLQLAGLIRCLFKLP